MTSARHFSVTLPKNTREDLQVALTEYEQHKCADIRIYAGDGDEKVPTRKGICIRVEQLPALRGALQQAEAEAQRLGFLRKEAA